ncbi:hypothetical protein KY335_03920 [Candidatus Woesearchaeota archaeon]|nr:hypothetical protein [Candidatus Woesearchaeota archaeon]
MQPEPQNIIKIEIKVMGRVNQSDIIGAVFGQTEDVLGETLELRKLQKENKIGRIEVETEYTPEGTTSMITIPSFMDQTHTVIIAAALETIKKIGPCKAEARVKKIENIKELKLKKIIEHAKKVLEKFMSVSVDSQELVDKVTYAVRMDQVAEYGDEKVPCGPGIETYDDLIFVETVDDLKNLLKYGIKNVVAFEDLSKQATLKDLADKHEVIVLINRGKEYLIKKLMEFADIDKMVKPDPGKRVIDLTSKELFKTIRAAVSTEQIVTAPAPTQRAPERKFERREQRPPRQEFQRPPRQEYKREEPRPQRVSIDPRSERLFKEKLAEIKGKGLACIIDRNLNVLGMIPMDGLIDTIKSINNVHSIIVDGKISRDLVDIAEKIRCKYLVGSESERTSRMVQIITNL